MDKGWQVAKIGDVGAHPPADDPAFWSDWTDDADYATGWHSLRSHFGIRGFGVNAKTAAAGHELVVRHEEVSFDSNEELYVVLKGRARFEFDDGAVELEPLDAIHVAAPVHRRAVALETPTVLLMIGGTPERPFDASAFSQQN